MTAAALPEGLDDELVRRQHLAVQAWRAELGRLLGERASRDLPEEEREVLRGWLRTRAAVDACLVRQARGALEPLGHGPRAVVVHRDPAFRAALEERLVEQGLQVLGGGRDGAVAVALAVVEQPDLLVVEDGLPWVSSRDVVAAVSRFARRTVAVVVAGQASPSEVLDRCSQALGDLGLSPVLRGGVDAG